ncbi:hydroxymethylbilane synthase [Runella sp. MFBS21]|uniref:hydroxymethylbilane synthase n=1 Tax=Runella sp. MFBS21 TaxID=3034018 RepID=UPI0023F61760|nr:hydroxymethylbilane synthase [Runella sp. MFBS21]MDF7820765.1 hydroxymethylbilane synthase [Runella sp. MFBS21]
MTPIKIGTRGSRLALWQAYYVENLLQKGGLPTEIVLIETKGDQILDRSLSKIGSKGVFTQELEDQLRDGRIDIAVHSAKDLQSELDEDLNLIAFTEREQVNDVLVSRNTSLSLKGGDSFTVGTSSTRRVALLKHFYPHIRTVDMRGNLQTRLRKLDEGQCDAILLAFAGVHRMEYDELIAEHLSLDEFTPAVGQGSVAIECSQTLDPTKRDKIRSLLNHADTETCLLAERAFLRRLQGGCSVPVFGLATLQADSLVMTGGVVSLDGNTLLKQTLNGSRSKRESVGTQLAEALLAQGAADILAQIKQNQ